MKIIVPKVDVLHNAGGSTPSIVAGLYLISDQLVTEDDNPTVDPLLF